MSKNKISNDSMIIEHQQIEALLQKFNKSKLHLINDFDYNLYPFAPINASFIGNYKYELNKPINNKDFLLLKSNINIDNVHIFYKYVDDETKYNFRQNIQIAHNNRWKDISNFLKKEGLIFETDKGMDYSVLYNNYECELLKLDSEKDLDSSITYTKNVSYFGIKDELSPLADYIEEIKNSDLYKAVLNKKLSDVTKEDDDVNKILKQHNSRDSRDINKDNLNPLKESKNDLVNLYKNANEGDFLETEYLLLDTNTKKYSSVIVDDEYPNVLRKSFTLFGKNFENLDNILITSLKINGEQKFLLSDEQIKNFTKSEPESPSLKEEGTQNKKTNRNRG